MVTRYRAHLQKVHQLSKIITQAVAKDGCHELVVWVRQRDRTPKGGISAVRTLLRQ